MDTSPWGNVAGWFLLWLTTYERIMSIENLLTLGLALGLLAAAAVLRMIVLGAWRLFFKLSGRDMRAREAPAETDPSTRTRRPIARPAPTGLGAFGRGLVYVLATLGTWMTVAGTSIARAAASSYESLSPRLTSGMQGVLPATGRALKTGLIVTLASVQHLGRLASDRMKERVAERARSRMPETPAEQPTEARVIRLDREWDPLTDPLEDQPVSNYR